MEETYEVTFWLDANNSVQYDLTEKDPDTVIHWRRCSLSDLVIEYKDKLNHFFSTKKVEIPSLDQLLKSGVRVGYVDKDSVVALLSKGVVINDDSPFLLEDFGTSFYKTVIGSYYVKLPTWFKNDFTAKYMTLESSTLVLNTKSIRYRVYSKFLEHGKFCPERETIKNISKVEILA